MRGHDQDVSLDLFAIKVVVCAFHLEASNICSKLSLQNIDHHLAPVGDMQPGDAVGHTRTLHAPSRPAVSPVPPTLSPQVR